MTDSRIRRMDDPEIEAFLRDRDTGVLGLARDDDAYAIPMSYTYDEESGDVYLRIGYGPESLKREYVDATDQVSFLVYAETDRGWRSVLARGRLTELSRTDELKRERPRASPRTSVQQAMRNLEIPFYEVFDPDASDLEFVVARIDVEELTGVAETGESIERQ